MSEDTKNSRKKDLYISSIEPSVSIRIGRTGIPVGSWQSTISMPASNVREKRPFFIETNGQSLPPSVENEMKSGTRNIVSEKLIPFFIIKCSVLPNPTFQRSFGIAQPAELCLRSIHEES